MRHRPAIPRRPPLRADTRADLDAVLVGCLGALLPDPAHFSVKAAAALVGVKASYLYDHVGDSSALLERVRAHAVARLVASLASIPSGMPAHEAAEAVASALLQPREWRGHLMALEMSPWQDRRRVQDEVGRILAAASKGRYREWLAGGVPGVALRGPALANPPTLEVARAEVYTMIMLVLRFGERQRGKGSSRKEL